MPSPPSEKHPRVPGWGWTESHQAAEELAELASFIPKAGGHPGAHLGRGADQAHLQQRPHVLDEHPPVHLAHQHLRHKGQQKPPVMALDPGGLKPGTHLVGLRAQRTQLLGEAGDEHHDGVESLGAGQPLALHQLVEVGLGGGAAWGGQLSRHPRVAPVGWEATRSIAPVGITRLGAQLMGTLPSTLVHRAGRPLPGLSRAAWAP